MEKIEELVGKEVTIGISEPHRLVIHYDGKEITLFASEKGIEIGDNEDITTLITPGQVVCEEAFLKPTAFAFFKLGRNRLLTASYLGKDDLRIVYLPDEYELDGAQSEFMEAMKRGS